MEKEGIAILKCNKCGKDVPTTTTCFECSEKELEGTTPPKCSQCNKPLESESCADEIILFYKDSDNDYEFCSADCLKQFVSKL